MKISDSVLDTLNIHIPYLYMKGVNYSIYLALRNICFSDKNRVYIIFYSINDILEQINEDETSRLIERFLVLR